MHSYTHASFTRTHAGTYARTHARTDMHVRNHMHILTLTIAHVHTDMPTHKHICMSVIDEIAPIKVHVKRRTAEWFVNDVVESIKESEKLFKKLKKIKTSN